MSDELPLTPQEQEELAKYLTQSGSAPMPEEKYNVHIFLHRVATADDTTKLGYLKDEEVGVPKHPVRSLKEFALIAESIIGNPIIADFFAKQSEIVTSTSLSRDGFLLRQATTKTTQMADITKPRKENKGWFKKDDKKEGQELTP